MGVTLNITTDFFIHKSEINQLTKRIEGIYVLLDHDKKPLYVGESRDVKNRVISHLTGYTNSVEYHEKINFIRIIEETDIFKRRLIEKYLISITPGVLNAAKPFDVAALGNERRFDKIRIFGLCRSELCKLHAHSNGYCRKHGGNGFSKTYIQHKALEDFLSGKYNPDLEND